MTDTAAATPSEDLRGDLKNDQGIDGDLLRFLLFVSPADTPEGKEYIQRRAEAGNRTALAHRAAMQNLDTW